MSCLTGEEMRVWRAFLVAHSRVLRRLEAELVAEHGLPLVSYDVLLQLGTAQGHRLRMNELAQRVLITRSGLTRLMDRLSNDGLVRREVCEDDARGLFAVLTPDGYRRLRAATDTHQRGVQGYVVGRFDSDELSRFGELLTLLAQEDEPLRREPVGRDLERGTAGLYPARRGVPEGRRTGSRYPDRR